VSNPRRKARWQRKRRRAATVPSPVRLTAMRWPLAAYRPVPIDWAPDVDNAHLFDAARGLSSIGLPLHPPAPVAAPC
jgi:hypothetical protein